MRLFLSIYLLLSVFQSYSQDFVAHSIWTNEVYRGYENKMVIGALNNKNKFKIEGRNCTVTHLEESTYIVKVNPGARSIYIRFLDKKGNAIDSIGFRVLNLPQPILCTDLPHKDTVERLGGYLRALYGAEIPLMANFEVVRWECPLTDKTFKGEGMVIPYELRKYFESLEGGESVTFFAEVKFPDGTIQTMNQSWTKK